MAQLTSFSSIPAGASGSVGTATSAGTPPPQMAIAFPPWYEERPLPKIPKPSVNLDYPLGLKGFDWYDWHQEEFVRKFLGRPAKPLLPEGSKEWKEKIKDPDCAYHFIRTYLYPKHVKRLVAVWQEAKRKSFGAPILLAGRDVWLLEVLARMEGIPTTFRPDISSLTRDDVVEDYSSYYLIDTGFRGSVPVSLQSRRWHLISHHKDNCGCTRHMEKSKKPGGLNMYVFDREFTNYRQLFPYATGNFLSLAGALECLPKYWNQARKKMDLPARKFVVNPLSPTKHVIEQTMSTDKTFEHAAQITTHVVTSLFMRPAKTYHTLSVGRGV